MDKSLKRWILRYAKGKYSDFSIEDAIKTADCFFAVTKNESYCVENYLTELMNASDVLLCIKSCIDIEKLLPLFINLADPSLLKQPPTPLFDGDKRTKWTLASYYKEALAVVPWDFNLSAATDNANAIERYKNERKYLYYYLLAYFYRNKVLSHVEIDPTPEDETAIISSFIVIFLDLCHRYHDVIEAAYEMQQLKESFSAEDYAESIIDRYENSEKAGFGYVNMSWYNPESSRYSDCDAAFLASEKFPRGLKLVGIAGTGKSTVLRRIEYISARNYLRKKSKALPIYIELADIIDGDDLLAEKIASILNIDESNASTYLKRGGATLLLDGFNEVLDPTVKRKLAKELDSLVMSESNVNIIISDRTINPSIPTLGKSEYMYLKPITAEQRALYFKSNCHDEKALDIINKQLNEDPGYFIPLDTPLKLKQLAIVVSEKGEIPDSLTEAYLSCLFEREKYDKKDENMEYLPMFLQSLSLVDDKEISLPRALNMMAKCKNAMGFSIPDTQKCLSLAVDMGVLAREGSDISFVSDEYRTYFFFKAVENGLDELLQG